MVRLYPHQKKALDDTMDQNKVAYYLDMGLGKTFVGAEKMKVMNSPVNLIVCQKSKIQDWIDHFNEHYATDKRSEFQKDLIFDLTNKKAFQAFINEAQQATEDYWIQDELTGEYYRQENLYPFNVVGVINYDLVFRRPELKQLVDFTLMLDESSLIQNENSKRSKFILKKLHPQNVILLSGTPTGGKYERLWSQLSLLGWKISKKLFYKQYVDFHYDDNEGFPIMIIDGYKNVERLKQKMRDYGCVFMKTEEVIDLPEQIHQTIKIPTTKEYRKFRKDCIVSIHKHIEVKGSDRYFDDYVQLVGDTTLTKMLYERQLCGQYNKEKLKAFSDLLESTNDRLIVFYNFNDELAALECIAHECDRPISLVNGTHKNVAAYTECDDSITFVQYQAGAMGLNLQKANKIVYFTPPLGSEIFEQSKKRIHRVGQNKTCFYYYLTCKGSIEERIYNTLKMRRDYTDRLFEEGK